MNSRRALSTSGRFSAADTSVPTTKPPCTAIVSHAVWGRRQMKFGDDRAFAAVAENHSVMPRNIASDSHASWTLGDRINQSRYLMNTTSFCCSL